MINPPLVIPNTFVNGTVIDAGQVNANFAQAVNFINTNDRFAITGNITFYVGPGGVDSGNTGLNQGAPCATVNYVYGLLQSQYIWANPSAVVTILMAPGNYNQDIFLLGTIPGQPSHSSVLILGNTSNPAAVTITGTQHALLASQGALVTIQGVTLITTTLDSLYADAGGLLAYSNVIFGNSGRGHVFVQTGGIVKVEGNYTVSGNMQWHWGVQGSGAGVFISPNALAVGGGSVVVTLTGTPTFTYWASGDALGSIVSYNNLSFVNAGVAVGQKYLFTTNSGFTTFTSGALILPGNTAGVTNTGGFYA